MSNVKFLYRLSNTATIQLLSKRTILPSIRSLADASQPDKVTHTGQHWEPNDYRLVRFTDKPKHVNENFALKLIAEVPPKECKERVTWCDGGGGPTGHPKVYINLDKPGNHSCGYCGLRFVLSLEHGH